MDDDFAETFPTVPNSVLFEEFREDKRGAAQADDYSDFIESSENNEEESDDDDDEKLSEAPTEEYVTPQREKSKTKTKEDEIEYVSEEMDVGGIRDILAPKHPFTHSQFVDANEQKKENILRKSAKEQKLKEKIKKEANEKKVIDLHLKHAQNKSQKKEMKKMRNQKTKKIKKLQKKLQNDDVSSEDDDFSSDNLMKTLSHSQFGAIGVHQQRQQQMIGYGEESYDDLTTDSEMPEIDYGAHTDPMQNPWSQSFQNQMRRNGDFYDSDAYENNAQKRKNRKHRNQSSVRRKQQRIANNDILQKIQNGKSSKRKRKKKEKPPKIVKPSKMNAVKCKNITKESIDVCWSPPEKDGFAMISEYQIQVQVGERVDGDAWDIKYCGMSKKFLCI